MTGLDFDLIWRVELIESGSGGGGGGGQLNRDLRLSRRTVDQREERCILYRSRVNYDLLQKKHKTLTFTDTYNETNNDTLCHEV